jgi:NAD(P)-dependent dehydrogenase (short-subunit alcohol dehydrogenase family)
MTALVTGAARRLGRAMALYLAGHGHDVAIHYAGSQDEAEATAAEIRALGRCAVTLQADLLDEAQVETLIPRAAQALGPLTVLVNNASIFERDSIETGTRQSWDRHFESNLRAPYVLTQAFARQCPPALADENGEPLAQGLVVNMLDQRVHKLTPDFSSYTLAKMGLWAFTQTAAMGLAPHIRVNGIGPGPTLQGAHQSAESFEKQRAATILGRGSNPADITAALGYFLDSPGVTGQMLCVDGGQHLAWKTPDVMEID